jgi:hypothetical protein
MFMDYNTTGPQRPHFLNPHSLSKGYLDTVDFVKTSWWGLKEARYPMRFSRNYEVPQWEINYGGGWELYYPAWGYP